MGREVMPESREAFLREVMESTQAQAVQVQRISQFDPRRASDREHLDPPSQGRCSHHPLKKIFTMSSWHSLRTGLSESCPAGPVGRRVCPRVSGATEAD